MLTVVKAVYYCEFCKRHRMTRRSIEEHEPRCVYNPNRTVCGWHDDRKAVGHAGTLAPQLKSDDLSVDELRVAMDGCPACMLAVVVQAGLSIFERDDLGFDYKTEVERFRDEERAAMAGDQW